MIFEKGCTESRQVVYPSEKHQPPYLERPEGPTGAQYVRNHNPQYVENYISQGRQAPAKRQGENTRFVGLTACGHDSNAVSRFQPSDRSPRGDLEQIIPSIEEAPSILRSQQSLAHHGLQHPASQNLSNRPTIIHLDDQEGSPSFKRRKIDQQPPDFYGRPSTFLVPLDQRDSHTDMRQRPVETAYNADMRSLGTHERIVTLPSREAVEYPNHHGPIKTVPQQGHFENHQIRRPPREHFQVPLLSPSALRARVSPSNFVSAQRASDRYSPKLFNATKPASALYETSNPHLSSPRHLSTLTRNGRAFADSHTLSQDEQRMEKARRELRSGFSDLAVDSRQHEKHEIAKGSTFSGMSNGYDYAKSRTDAREGRYGDQRQQGVDNSSLQLGNVQQKQPIIHQGVYAHDTRSGPNRGQVIQQKVQPQGLNPFDRRPPPVTPSAMEIWYVIARFKLRVTQLM